MIGRASLMQAWLYFLFVCVCGNAKPCASAMQWYFNLVHRCTQCQTCVVLGKSKKKHFPLSTFAVSSVDASPRPLAMDLDSDVGDVGDVGDGDGSLLAMFGPFELRRLRQWLGRVFSPSERCHCWSYEKWREVEVDLLICWCFFIVPKLWWSQNSIEQR